SYLCDINVGNEPTKYLRTIKLLMEEVESNEDIPTLINYMGFAQGIGLNIVSSAITFILPTDIIQISSKIFKKNFKKDLTVETVRENCGLFGGDLSNVGFSLHKLMAMTDDNSGWTLEPRQAREMCVLSYLGQMMCDGISSLASCKLSMYQIDLDSIAITDADGSEISPAAANANLVALCSKKINSKIFICMGYGIVRGIDLAEKTLVLMTPEAPEVLEDVFYLVVGSVSLPPSVYMTPDEITGNISYVMEGELVSLGQITKRSYMPVNKK
ncbi:Polynucleotide 5'-hydroxyl-kinase NOL9, partial [Gonioctena quinquepunctata]